MHFFRYQRGGLIVQSEVELAETLPATASSIRAPVGYTAAWPSHCACRRERVCQPVPALVPGRLFTAAQKRGHAHVFIPAPARRAQRGVRTGLNNAVGLRRQLTMQSGHERYCR